MSAAKKEIANIIDTTKKGLVAEVSKNTGFSQKDVKVVLSAFQRTILTVLKSDNEVRLLDLGKIRIAETSERTAINPQTKEKILVKAKKTPKVTFSKRIKEYVNNKDEQWPDFDF